MLPLPTELLREVIHHLPSNDAVHLKLRSSLTVLSGYRDLWSLSRVDRRAFSILLETGVVRFERVADIQLFAETLPHAVPLVRSIEYSLSELVFYARTKSPILNMLLATKVHLPDVEKIIVTCVDTGCKDDFGSPIWGQLRFPSVKHLEFVLSEHFTCLEMVSLIRAFPNIESLDMCDDVAIQGMGSTVRLPRLKNLTLRSREREDDDDNEFVGIKSDYHSYIVHDVVGAAPQNIETLSLDRLNILRDRYVGPTLRANVKHLSAQLSDWEKSWDGESDRELDYVTLSRMEQLKTLDLVLIPLHQRQLPKVLKCLPPTVRILRISATAAELVALPDRLELHASSELALVSIRVADRTSGGSYANQAIKMLGNQLKHRGIEVEQWHEKGIL